MSTKEELAMHISQCRTDAATCAIVSKRMIEMVRRWPEAEQIAEDVDRLGRRIVEFQTNLVETAKVPSE